MLERRGAEQSSYCWLGAGAHQLGASGSHGVNLRWAVSAMRAMPLTTVSATATTLGGCARPGPGAAQRHDRQD